MQKRTCGREDCAEPIFKKVSTIHSPLPDSLAKAEINLSEETGLQGVCVTSTGDPANVLLLDNLSRLENFCPLSTTSHGGDPVVFSTNVYTHSEGFSDRQVLLDTCAGESVFRNRKLFYSIMPSTTPVIINGVNPHGEPLVITESGETDFGTVYFDSNCIANILSFGNIVNNSESVSYDSAQDCYKVRMQKLGPIYKFIHDQSTNIYLCDLDKNISYKNVNFDNSISVMVTTVTDKKKLYTVRQVKAAELAREYQRKLGYASPGQLIKLIGQGKLEKSNITAQDVVRALDIFGPDLGSLKGKTTSHKAELEEELPVMHRQFLNQIMYIDLMFVNSLPYLISVTNPLEYVMISKLSRKNNSSLWMNLESNINHITKYGFKITMIRVDGEAAINTLNFESKLALLGIILDSTGAGEAVAVVERKIRHVKEKVRAVVNTLPFSLTELLEGWLVRYAVNRIDLVPTRNDLGYVSPREKLYGRKINVEKELKHGFGDYVQVHTDSVDNSNKPRSQAAIALVSAGNLEGSWYYMLLGNQKIVKRTKATKLPMTEDVIVYLNKLASERKVNQSVNAKQPIFEQNNQILEDDGIDYSNEQYDLQTPDMITPYSNSVGEEFIHHEIENNFDSYDNIEQTVYESEYDQLNEDLPNDIYVNVGEDVVYDDTPTDSQTLMNDIFGLDSDDEITENIEIIDNSQSEEILEQHPRRSARNHQLGRWSKKVVGLSIPSYQNSTLCKYMLNMTVTDGIQKLGEIAVDSIKKELQQMCDKDVWEGVHLDSLSYDQKKRIITSSMFLKDKYTADGKFDKLKSRLVAGGHLQDRNIHDNGSSPTVSTTSVFIVSAIAAKENRAVATIDFPGAFLNSDMPLDGDHAVLMRLNKYLTNTLISIDKSYQKYVNNNGTCVVKLKKALYGCVESAKLWYDKISDDLTKLDYKVNPSDICVFNRIEKDNKQTTLVIHVDDMMISSSDDKRLDKVIKEIEDLYPGLTKNRGKILNYIGMTFNYEQLGKVSISMEGFIKDLLEDCVEIVGVSTSPANNNLFTIDETSPLLPDKMRERYHSLTAKLLYLSKRTRPDILTSIAYLTKRVLEPRTDDWKKLARTIQYIRGTRTIPLTLEVDTPVKTIAYIDASYAVHIDKKSHTGCIITLGKGAIYGKSSTQKLNTISSTEAELVAMTEAGNQVLWTRNFLIHQEYEVSPATIYQDNLSTIQLIKNGRSNSERTRHIDVKFFFLHDRIKLDHIIVTYKSTKEMIADLLTKPLQGEQFRALRDQVLNV